MNCPTCGRALTASAGRCVYCGQGTRVRAREQLSVPEGTLPGLRRRAFPWGRLVAVVLLGGIAAVAYFHPEARAAIKSFIDWF